MPGERPHQGERLKWPPPPPAPPPLLIVPPLPPGLHLRTLAPTAWEGPFPSGIAFITPQKKLR